MAEKPIPEKKEDKRHLLQLVVDHNTRARITYELARQLEAHLPIKSYKELMEDLKEVVIDKHRLSLKMFAPYVTEDIFPIESDEDLVRALSKGVHTALALADSPSFAIKNPAVRSVLSTARQDDPSKRQGIPIVFGSLTTSAIKQRQTGGA